MARLNADGTLDSSFDPGTGADGTVYAVAPQKDGKVIIAGDFAVVDGLGRNAVARLNADGSVDAAFIRVWGRMGRCALALQSDGKILIGGLFTLWMASRAILWPG